MRRTWLERGSVYRGTPSMWAFLLHRVTGVVLAAWVVLFALERSLLLLSSTSYNRFHEVAGTGPFRLLDIAVLGAALFHALNGLRLVLLDVKPDLAARRDELIRAQTAVFFALMVPASWVVLARFFRVG